MKFSFEVERIDDMLGGEVLRSEGMFLELSKVDGYHILKLEGKEYIIDVEELVKLSKVIQIWVV